MFQCSFLFQCPITFLSKLTFSVAADALVFVAPASHRWKTQARRLCHKCRNPVNPKNKG